MLDLNSLTDLESFFADNPAESVGLEYKSSKILAKGEIGPICKGVSAFANSAGGTFVIGIDAKDGRTTLDDGWQGQSKLDWIYRAINSGTFPAVETAIVKEVQGESGKYYVISVGVSKDAPHQGQDNRYYKRRGSHSDPMEHYEIEDVRNRPKGKGSPLEISLFPEGLLASFKVRNISESDVIDHLKISVESNFTLDHDWIKELSVRGLRQLRPSVEHVFILDSFYSMSKETNEPEIKITATFEVTGRHGRVASTFYLADYMSASVVRSPVVRAIDDVGEKVERVAKSFEQFGRDSKAFVNAAVDGSGIRLSQRTIKGLLRNNQLFDPMEFDWDGYRILLDISIDEAFKLHHVFGTMMRSAKREHEYRALPELLRKKFETLFKIDFSDSD